MTDGGDWYNDGMIGGGGGWRVSARRVMWMEEAVPDRHMRLAARRRFEIARASRCGEWQWPVCEWHSMGWSSGSAAAGGGSGGAATVVPARALSATATGGDCFHGVDAAAAVGSN